MSNIIYRFSEPSRMDTAEFKTICKVKCNASDKTLVYVQISSRPEDPRWNLVAEFKNDVNDEIIQQVVAGVLK